MIELLESGLHWLGALTGLGTLGYSIANMLIAQRKPTGQQTGVARHVLRTPYLVVATILFLLAGYFFWKPLPLNLTSAWRLALSIIGIIIMLPNLAVYIWGVRTLGYSFNASSGFGVRLQRAHQLIIKGPFAIIRHPMYAAVILAFWGGLLLYRTWTMLGTAVIMFGLVYRGYKEEEALAQAFGSEWEAYRQSVPGWLPRIKNRKQRSDE